MKPQRVSNWGEGAQEGGGEEAKQICNDATSSCLLVVEGSLVSKAEHKATEIGNH